MNLSSDAWAIIGVLFTIIVALIFFILGLRVEKPKLVAQGSGSGTVRIPNRDVMATSLNVSNLPTFWGMKVNRGTAEINSARLYDPSLREYVGPVLLWQENGSQELNAKCTIEPGTQGRLYVFAKDRHEKEYFIPSGKSLDAELNRPTNTWADQRKDFSVHLFDSIGRVYKFDIIARNSDQSVSVGYKMTMHTRVQLVKSAFGDLRRAFTIRQK